MTVDLPNVVGTFPRGFSRDTNFAWPLVRAEQLVTLNYGKALVERNRQPGKIPVYGTNGQCGWHNKGLIEGPGVILGRKGMGPLGVEWCETDYWVIDTAYYVTPNTPDLDLKFFYYLVKYIGLNHLKDGTSNPSLSRDTFSAQLLPFPPIAEQKAIAHILGTLDDKIELNQQMNRTLEGIARALFKSWFIDFDPVRAKLDGRQPDRMDAETAALFPDAFEDGGAIGPTPKGWRVSSLDKLFPKDKGCVITGPFGSNLHAHDYREKGIPLILVKHVNNGRIQEQNLPLVGSHKFPELSRYLLEEGDIIFTRVGAVGRTAYIYPKYVGWLISGQTLRVRINNREVLNPRYLAQVYLEPSFIQMVEAQALGTTRPSLNTKILKAFNFLLPSIRVQNRFIQLIQPLDIQIQNNFAEMKSLSTIRDTLLPKFLSGEIQIKETEQVVEAVT
jgi:type I restriction enzyme S subunit